MATIGFDVRRFQLVAYVISGGLGGFAGFLLANLTEFVSPAYMSWQHSGELIVMVILGGVGTLDGAHHRQRRLSARRGMAVGHHRKLEGDLRADPGAGRAVRARRPDRRSARGCGGGAGMAEPLLRLEGLRKNFGAWP